MTELDKVKGKVAFPVASWVNAWQYDKHDRFYADRHVRSASPLGSSKNKTSRVPSVASDHRSSGHNNGHSNTNVNNDRGHNTGNGNHNTPNRQIAQNTNAHHSGSGHFGGRR